MGSLAVPGGSGRGPGGPGGISGGLWGSGAREGAMEVPGIAPGVPNPPRDASVNPADLPRGRDEVPVRSPGAIIRGVWASP